MLIKMCTHELKELGSPAIKMMINVKNKDVKNGHLC